MPKTGTDYTWVVVLCEDLQQELFARYFLTTYYNLRDNRRIVIRRSRAGKGSAEQFVRENLIKEVKTYRRECNKKTIALVVMIDEDTSATQNRRDDLEQILKDAGEKSIKTDERIAIFVPQRNIETWIHFLMDEEVDEETSYPKLENSVDCKLSVQNLAVACLNNKPLAESAPDSLKQGCQELERIPRL